MKSRRKFVLGDLIVVRDFSRDTRLVIDVTKTLDLGNVYTILRMTRGEQYIYLDDEYSARHAYIVISELNSNDHV